MSNNKDDTNKEMPKKEKLPLHRLGLLDTRAHVRMGSTGARAPTVTKRVRDTYHDDNFTQQCAKRTLDKIAKLCNENDAGLNCMLHRFRKIFCIKP